MTKNQIRIIFQRDIRYYQTVSILLISINIIITFILFLLASQINLKKTQSDKQTTLRRNKVDLHVKKARILNLQTVNYTIDVGGGEDINSLGLYRRYQNTPTENGKVEYLIKYLEDNMNLDQFTILENGYQTPNQNCETPPIAKYFLNELKNFASKLEEEDPNSDFKLVIPEKVILNLTKLMYFANDMQVKIIVSFLLYFFTGNSQIISRYFMNNSIYFEILFKLSFSNEFILVKNILCIFSYVLTDNSKQTFDILQAFPFHIRIFEILKANGVTIHLESNFERELIRMIHKITSFLIETKHIDFLDVKYFYLIFRT
ncbi:MAG: hypothetical protein MJ252_24130 [archaeon]|nr:hypothetical protein [archaeon]